MTSLFDVRCAARLRNARLSDARPICLIVLRNSLRPGGLPLPKAVVRLVGLARIRDCARRLEAPGLRYEIEVLGRVE